MSKVNESARSRNNYSVIRSLEVELAWLQHRGAVMTRRRLPNRRLAETFDLEVGGLRYVASIGRFADGALAEVFLTNGKCGSDADTAARDGAVVASIAMQYLVPLDVIRHALMRNRDGSACGPLGAALDRLHAREAEHERGAS